MQALYSYMQVAPTPTKPPHRLLCFHVQAGFEKRRAPLEVMQALYSYAQVNNGSWVREDMEPDFIFINQFEAPTMSMPVPDGFADGTNPIKDHVFGIMQKILEVILHWFLSRGLIFEAVIQLVFLLSYPFVQSCRQPQDFVHSIGRALSLAVLCHPKHYQQLSLHTTVSADTNCSTWAAEMRLSTPLQLECKLCRVKGLHTCAGMVGDPAAAAYRNVRDTGVHRWQRAIGPPGPF